MTILHFELSRKLLCLFTQLLLYSLLPYSVSLPTIMIEESSRWCSFLCWMLLVAAPGPRNLNNFCNTHLGSKHLQTLKARVNYSVGPRRYLVNAGSNKQGPSHRYISESVCMFSSDWVVDDVDFLASTISMLILWLFCQATGVSRNGPNFISHLQYVYSLMSTQRTTCLL